MSPGQVNLCSTLPYVTPIIAFIALCCNCFTFLPFWAARHVGACAFLTTVFAKPNMHHGAPHIRRGSAGIQLICSPLLLYPLQRRYLNRLQQIRDTLEVSEFFRKHEVRGVGSGTGSVCGL